MANQHGNRKKNMRGQVPKRVCLRLDCVALNTDENWCLTQGLPFAEGELESGAPVALVDEAGRRYPAQAQVLATWRPDRRHVKWLLLDAQLPGRLASGQNLYVEYGANVETVMPDDPVQIEFIDENFGHVSRIGNSRLRLQFRNMFMDPKPQFLMALELRKGQDWENLLRKGTGIESYIVDSRGNVFDTASPSAPPVWITLEERGPVRSSMCIRGMHAGRDGIQAFPFILRLHVFAGSGKIRMFHTFVFDQNPDCVKLAGIGARFQWACGPNPAMLFGGAKGAQVTAGGNAASWLQDSDRHFIIGADNQTIAQGEKTSGWAGLSSLTGSVVAVLRDAWQEYPKGIALDKRGLMDLQLWPQAAEQILDLEVPWKGDFINCCAENIRTEEQLLKAMAERPTAGVNFKGFYGTVKMPPGSAEGNLQSIREARAFAEKHLANHRFVIGDVSYMGRAVGLAKTHEIWLDLRPGAIAPEAAERWAAHVQTPPLALPDPSYICSTGALRIAHPQDREKFKAVEDGLEAVFDNLLDGPVADNRLYGMLNYGDLLNCHGRTHGYTYRVFKDYSKAKITDIIGWYNTECFDHNYTRWLDYLRTGERKYWRLAETYAEHLEDVDTVHADPLHPEWVGLTHYHNILHWSGGPSVSHTAIHGWLLHYFLTGNRRALEVARAAADNALRNQEPAGMVANRYSALRREYTAPMGNLWFFYQTTWEERYGDCARRSLEIFLKSQGKDGKFPRDIFTGGERGDEFHASPAPPEPRGWMLESDVLYDVYRLTRDPKIRKAVIACADAIVETNRNYIPNELADLLGHTYMIAKEPPTMWLAFAHELTADPRYRKVCAEYLRDLPAMAQSWAAFDKWTPFQLAGYVSRHAATAMAAVLAAKNKARHRIK